MSRRTDPEVIHALGIWGLRIALVAGCVTLAALGKEDEAALLGMAVLWSFFFL